MRLFSRTDTSIFGRWWWTVDRWLLAAILLLYALGIVMSLASSPAVAQRLDVDSFFFVRRQLMFIVPSLGLLIGFSLMSAVTVRRIAAVIFVVGIVCLVAVLFVGPDIKGATRWLLIGPYNFQPSEFVKPAFACVAAWMFSEQKKSDGFPGNLIAIALYVVTVGLVFSEPDVGQSVLITAVFLVQFFLAGLPLGWVLGGAGLGVVGVIGSYFTFEHVSERVNRFFSAADVDSYQIDHALNAFRAGGLFGRGPGEGIVKTVLPDAHSDFIFAVAGEEFGMLACIGLLALFAFVVLRALFHLLQEEDRFTFLATAGIVTQFGLQAIINMAVNTDLMPSKGMTLPFISYGGSSLLALGMGMGMVLALTRRRHHRAPNLRVWAYSRSPLVGGRP
jgi:cell division protein FtsW